MMFAASVCFPWQMDRKKDDFFKMQETEGMEAVRKVRKLCSTWPG